MCLTVLEATVVVDDVVVGVVVNVIVRTFLLLLIPLYLVVTNICSCEAHRG